MILAVGALVMTAAALSFIKYEFFSAWILSVILACLYLGNWLLLHVEVEAYQNENHMRAMCSLVFTFLECLAPIVLFLAGFFFACWRGHCP